MISTCFSCGARFKENTALRDTRFGRTIAFYETRGFLWIVCDRCGRWSLAPIEHRLEAIEECQRVFEETPVRDTTGGISRGALPGLRLIRIGDPAPHEIALWRHCGRLDRRNRMYTALGGAAVVTIGAAEAAAMYWLARFPLLVGLTAAFAAVAAIRVVASLLRNRSTIPVTDDRGRRQHLRHRDLLTTVLVRAESGAGWGIRLLVRGGPIRIVGDDAVTTLRAALAVSITEVAPSALQEALRFLYAHEPPSLSPLCIALAKPDRTSPRRPWLGIVTAKDSIHTLPLFQRVALEIAALEELERPAALGDVERILAELESAEEIAEIADNLLLPQEVVRRFERIKAGLPSAASGR